MNKPSAIPSYKTLQKQINRVVFPLNLVGAMVSFLYFSVINPLPVGQTAVNPEGADLYSIAIFVLFMIGVNLLGERWGHKREQRIADWYEKRRAGLPATAVPDTIRRDVLNTPFVSAFMAATLWVIAGLFFSVLFTPNSGGVPSLQMFIGITGVGGVLTTVLVFFVLDIRWRPVVAIFFPNGSLSSVNAYRLPILGRLLLTFMLVGLWPPLMLAVTTTQRAQQLINAPNPEAILQNMYVLQAFLLLFGAAASAGLAIFMTRGITLPLEALQQGMAAVENNDLEARVAVTSNDELGYLSERFNQMTAGLRQTDMLRNLLNLYVSPEVAQEALAHGAELGGTAVECSILFADIRDFTSISEQMEAKALLRMLNAYMTAMVEVIIAHGGIVNKFGGDSLLAIFGTPINPAADHAAQAAKTAQEMMTALHIFNTIQHKSGGTALVIGIGVATGTVIAGNVGGRERLEYTVIGDTVNLASRLQDKTKALDGNILLSAETHAQAVRVMGLEGVWETAVYIKGKQHPVKAFRLNSPVAK